MSITRSALFHGEPPLYLTSPALTRAGLAHLFTTRHFPAARSPDNPAAPFATEPAAAIARRAGLDGQTAAFLKQVHGAAVVRAGAGGFAGSGDVLVSDRPGLPLTIFTADCLPIVLYDSRRRRLAVVHAGWRGTAQSVAAAAATVMLADGGRGGDLTVAIGPSIGPCCYEVDRPVIDSLAAAFPSTWASWVVAKGRDRLGEDRWMLDLWKANDDQLRSAGVPADRIDNPRLCTACRTDLFFSYRRGGGRGRLITAAALPD